MIKKKPKSIDADIPTDIPRYRNIPLLNANEILEYRDKNPRASIPKETMNDLYGIYKIVKEYLNKFELKWWATGGTLLGAIRHKGIIPWDDDIDIDVDMTKKFGYNIMYDNMIKALKNDGRLKVVREKSMGTTDAYETMGGVGHIVFFKGTNSPSVGLTKIKQGAYRMNYNWVIPQSGAWHDCVYKVSEIFPLQTRKFGKMTINIPNQWKPYIRRCYSLKALNEGIIEKFHNPYKELKPKEKARFKMSEFNKIKDKF